MKKFSGAIKYSEYSWNICGDLKVISLLRGFQLGYTKHVFFMSSR